MAKALRREKRRDEATAVAALRRPGWDDWALNVVAAEQPETVDAFTRAAGDVRDAQAAAIEGRDGPDIREALKTLRERSGELVALATDALGRVGREPGPGELNARLSEVAGSETGAAQLRAGILGSGDAAPQDLFADLEPASHPAPRPKPAKAKDAAKRAAKPRGPAVDRREEARQQRRREAIAAATAKHDAATEALEQADAAVQRAERELAAAQRERDKAATAAERTAAALERAQA
jgi:hypothetical protein